MTCFFWLGEKPWEKPTKGLVIFFGVKGLLDKFRLFVRVSTFWKKERVSDAETFIERMF